MRGMHRSTLALVLVAVGMAAFTPGAYAVPSFSRQTGLACAACHTIIPR